MKFKYSYFRDALKTLATIEKKKLCQNSIPCVVLKNMPSFLEFVFKNNQ